MLIQSHNIFQIQRQYLEIMQQIEEAEGEITPQIDEALRFTELQMQEAAINIGMVVKSLDYRLEVLNEEIQRLTNLKEKTEKSKALLKNRLSQSMQQFGIEKVESPTLTISFRKSEAVEILSEQQIPAVYFDIPAPRVSKARIREALKAGHEVPGAELAARKNLQIK
jgi:hypothetical protein